MLFRNDLINYLIQTLKDKINFLSFLFKNKNMKKLVIVIASILFLSNCDKVMQGIVIKHNDAIIAESDKVVDAFNKLNNSLAIFNVDSIDLAMKSYNQQIDATLLRINKVISFNDSSLKTATTEMIHVFKSVGDNEFTQIRTIYTIPDSLYNNDNEKEVTALAEAIDEKIETAQNKQRVAQKAFAQKYNFVLMVGKDTIK